MAHIIDVLSKYVVNKKIMVGVFIFIVFIIVIIWWMRRRKSPGTFDDVANSMNRGTTSTDPDTQANSGKEALIYFFHADWCPHCKKAQPEWDAFKMSQHNKLKNGYVVKCISVDCTNDKESTAKQLINEFNIESYPSVKMVKDNTTIDYDASVKTASLNKFVDIMLV
jgi:thiol-disulfide isomerase/thioredoxin